MKGERLTREKIAYALMGHDEYHRAFGHFLSMYSDIEARMQEVLRHFAGVTEPIAKAIFSGTRTDGARKFIRRIADATNWPEERKKEWDKIFAQLGEIQFLRNQLVHYGALWQDLGSWVVSDRHVAHIPEQATQIPVSPTIFADAIADLEKIDTHLYALAWPEAYSLHKADLDETLKREWRYKPPADGGRKPKPKKPKHSKGKRK